MEFWFSEFHTPDVKHSIRVSRQLYSKQSDTPILTIQGEKDVQETTIQEQEENKRQSKKKDKKE